jgi:hypothetical protein
MHPIFYFVGFFCSYIFRQYICHIQGAYVDSSPLTYIVRISPTTDASVQVA